MATTRVVPPAAASAAATPPPPPPPPPAAAAAPAAAAKPKSNYNAIRSPGALSGISFGSGPSASAPKPASAKKPVDSIANRVAAMFTTKAMAQKNAEFAKSQKAKGYAAGGAGKVRKGMMKGK